MRNEGKNFTVQLPKTCAKIYLSEHPAVPETQPPPDSHRMHARTHSLSHLIAVHCSPNPVPLAQTAGAAALIFRLTQFRQPDLTRYVLRYNFIEVCLS